MRSLARVSIGLCIGCASIPSIPPIATVAPITPSASIATNDALQRLPQVGHRPIDTAQIDFPLLAAAVFAESNRQRRMHQLASLVYLPALETISTLHAKDMVLHQFFDHVNPVDPRKRTVVDRLGLVDLAGSFYAENIARTFPLQIDLRSDRANPYRSDVYPLDEPGQFSLVPYGTPIPPHTYFSFAKDLVESWMNSPAHRQNLLAERAHYLGCGCAHEVDEAGFSMLVCGQVFYAD